MPNLICIVHIVVKTEGKRGKKIFSLAHGASDSRGTPLILEGCPKLATYHVPVATGEKSHFIGSRLEMDGVTD